MKTCKLIALPQKLPSPRGDVEPRETGGVSTRAEKYTPLTPLKRGICKQGCIVVNRGWLAQGQ